jgi:hypothetical protein
MEGMMKQLLLELHVEELLDRLYAQSASQNEAMESYFTARANEGSLDWNQFDARANQLVLSQEQTPDTEACSKLACIQTMLKHIFLSFALVTVLAACSPSLQTSTADSVLMEQLYFGRNAQGVRVVSDSAWDVFVREIVTPHFPKGFSVWSAQVSG